MNSRSVSRNCDVLLVGDCHPQCTAPGHRRQAGNRGRGMNVVILMIPGTVVLALVALAAFIWSLRSGQYDDPAGTAACVLLDNDRPE